MNRLEERLRSSLDRAATDLPDADRREGVGMADRRSPRRGLGPLLVAAAVLVATVLTAPLVIRQLDEPAEDPAASFPVTTNDQAPITWERRNAPPAGTAESVLMAAVGDVLIASATIPDPDAWIVQVWRSIDGGFTWQQTLTLTDEGVDVALEADEEQAILLLTNHVGAGGASAYRTIDGGATWTHIDLEAPAGAADIAATAVALGEESVIIGQAWDGATEESPAEGVGMTSYEGWRAITWSIENGIASPPADVVELGFVSSVVVHDGRSHAAGNPLESSVVPSPDLWVSDDGSTWSQAVLPSLPDPWQFDNDTMSVAANDSMLVATAELRAGPGSGFADTRDHVATAVFRTTTGGDWTLSVIEDKLIAPISTLGTGFVGRIDTGGETHVGLSDDGHTWSITGGPFALTDAASTDEGGYVIGLVPGSENPVQVWFFAR